MKEAQELLKKMSEFEYGWIDRNGLKYVNKISKINFFNDYFLQSPEEVEKNKIGICWDQVEYERKYFLSKNIPHKTIFMFYDDGKKFPLHTFLIFKENEKYYWFENTYPRTIGAFEFNSLTDCFAKIKIEFMKENLLEDVGDKLYWLEYTKPEYGINYEEFVNHCKSGILATKDFSNIDDWN